MNFKNKSNVSKLNIIILCMYKCKKVIYLCVRVRARVSVYLCTRFLGVLEYVGVHEMMLQMCYIRSSTESHIHYLCC